MNLTQLRLDVSKLHDQIRRRGEISDRMVSDFLAQHYLNWALHDDTGTTQGELNSIARAVCSGIEQQCGTIEIDAIIRAKLSTSNYRRPGQRKLGGDMRVGMIGTVAGLSTAGMMYAAYAALFSAHLTADAASGAAHYRSLLPGGSRADYAKFAAKAAKYFRYGGYALTGATVGLVASAIGLVIVGVAILDAEEIFTYEDWDSLYDSAKSIVTTRLHELEQR